MAKIALLNVGLMVAEFDVGADVNQATLSTTVRELDSTCFGAADATDKNWETSVAGTRMTSFQYQGYMDYASAQIESEAIDNIGVSAPVTVLPAMSSTPALGDRAYFFQARRFSATAFGDHGELAGAQIGATGATGPLVRGELLVPKAAITSTSASAASQLGAVAATQKVYAALHVFTVSGTSPTLDVTVDSDDNSGMTTPTTRLTFTQATAATSEWQQLAGAITDDYWRVSYTLGGTSPSFTFAVSVGVA